MIFTDTIPYHQAFSTHPVPLSVKDCIDAIPQTTPVVLFGNKNQNIVNHPVEHPQVIDFQPFWILVFSMAFIALVGNLMFHGYKNYFLSFFIPRLKSTNAENDERSGLLDRVISLFFILNFSLFIYRLSNFHSWSLFYNHALERFVFIFLIILIFWLLKTSITLFIQSIFTNWKNGLSILKINQHVEFIFLIILVPANFLFYYLFNSYHFGYFVLLIMALFLLIGMVKLFLNIQQLTTLRRYQIIVYLCTLEILPLLVIFKYFAD